MEEFRANVYHPPTTDFPIVAVIFDQDDRIVKSKVVLSEIEGQNFIVEMLTELRHLDYLDRPR
jgi:hypothetical protein